MAWIELHQTLPTNKKTLRLKSLLKIKTPQAVGHLCMLWLWALDNAQDGDISKFTAEEIAEVSGWAGKSSEIFIEALTKAGFLDNDMRLHDWDEYAGKLMDKRDIQREQARVRQQRRRDKLKESRECNNYVTGDDGVNNVPIQYHTVPHPTVPSSSCDGAGAREDISEVMTYYMDKINPSPSSGSCEELLGYIPILGKDVVIKAMSIAQDEGKRQWSYIRAILQSWVSQGVKSLLDVQRIQNERDRAKKEEPKPTGRPQNRNQFADLIRSGALDE